MKTRKKGKDYTLPIALVICLILVALGSRSPGSFKGVNNTQIQTTSAAPVDDIGPTSDGSTTLTIVNSIPYPMTFRISAKGGINKKIQLQTCETCKIYSGPSDIPADVYARGIKETIVVSPGKNFVDWSHQGGNISPIQAYWELKPGRKYSICTIMDMTRGRSDWNTAK
jgi:hypothetical protein